LSFEFEAKMLGLDLFAGAGGMSCGAAQAGVRIRLAVENDVFAANTYRKNHRHTRLLTRDIRSVRKRQLSGLFRRKQPLVVFGGPPCQGFSYSNLRTRSSDNPNNWLFLEFLRVVRLLRPEWIVFENVRGLENTAGGVFFDEVTSRIAKLKYSVAHAVLNAKDYGVPQDRGRLFIVARSDLEQFTFPKALAGEPRTVRQAIDDLPLLANGDETSEREYRKAARYAYARSLRGDLVKCANHLVTRSSDMVIERYRHVPQAGNWEAIPKRLMRNYKDRSRCHTGIYHRLAFDEPSVVIGNFRKNMLIHPSEHRGLSVREAARIQSFPDSFEFFGSIGFQQQQVGNAVPPLLAASVFSAVVAQSQI